MGEWHPVSWESCRSGFSWVVGRVGARWFCTSQVSSRVDWSWMGSRVDHNSRVDKSWMGCVGSGRVEDSRMGDHRGSFVGSQVDSSWKIGDSRGRSQLGGVCRDVLGWEDDLFGCVADDLGPW